MRGWWTMKIALFSGAVAAALAVLGPAWAADYPLPLGDYEMTATVERARKPAVVRYHAGTLRIEADLEGFSGVVLLDPRRSTGTVLADVLGNKVAMPIDPDHAPVKVPSRPQNAKRTGRDRVAGESCDVWTFTNPISKRTDSSCVTGDGITLRLTVDGKVEMEATKLARRPQDAALFVVPASYRRMPLTLPGLPLKR
jgi:hypothetical protein